MISERDAGAETTVPMGFEQVREDEKIRRVLSHFERVAHRYDLMNTILSLGIHRLWKRAAVRALDLEPGDRVLDLCGGTGDLAVLAGKRVTRSGSVVLYDMSRAMMKAGMTKVKRRAPCRINFVQGDAEWMALRSEAFDKVIIGFGMRNLTHKDHALQEIRRVLRPGGKMICLEFARPRARLFVWLYDLYSFSLMPIVGQVLAGSRDAYRYLAESIRVFSTPEEIGESLRNKGFMAVRYRRMTGGIAVIHEATKGAEARGADEKEGLDR